MCRTEQQMIDRTCPQTAGSQHYKGLGFSPYIIIPYSKGMGGEPIMGSG